MESEEEANRKYAEQLLIARTEQLRTAMIAIDELSEALEPFRPDVVEKVRATFGAR